MYLRKLLNLSTRLGNAIPLIPGNTQGDVMPLIPSIKQSDGIALISSSKSDALLLKQMPKKQKQKSPKFQRVSYSTYSTIFFIK